MTLSKKIAFLRRRDGMSQEDLAEILSLSRQSIYKWETGETTPSIENLKIIAKLFDVSFDFLMDDSIGDSIQEESINKGSNIERDVFFTGRPLDPYQIDIDNGYAANRRVPLSADNYLLLNNDNAKQELDSLNITDIHRIHAYSASYFFYDSSNKTIGFFYGGMIQFICPIENILDFTYGGGRQKFYNSKATVRSIGFDGDGISSVGFGTVPSLKAHTDTEAWATLSYKSGNEINQFELKFSVQVNTFADLCYSEKDLEACWSDRMAELLDSLEKIKSKISALREIAQKIIDGSTPVSPIDYSIYEDTNKILEERYNTYLKDIAEDAKDANKSHNLKKAFLGIAIGIFVVSFIVWLIVWNSNH